VKKEAIETPTLARMSPQRRYSDTTGRMVSDDTVSGDEGFLDDRECEEDLETTEGEGVDFPSELLELSGWTQVNDEETEKD